MITKIPKIDRPNYGAVEGYGKKHDDHLAVIAFGDKCIERLKTPRKSKRADIIAEYKIIEGQGLSNYASCGHVAKKLNVSTQYVYETLKEHTKNNPVDVA